MSSRYEAECDRAAFPHKEKRMSREDDFNDFTLSPDDMDSGQIDASEPSYDDIEPEPVPPAPAPAPAPAAQPAAKRKPKPKRKPAAKPKAKVKPKAKAKAKVKPKAKAKKKAAKPSRKPAARKAAVRKTVAKSMHPLGSGRQLKNRTINQDGQCSCFRVAKKILYNKLLIIEKINYLIRMTTLEYSNVF